MDKLNDKKYQIPYEIFSKSEKFKKHTLKIYLTLRMKQEEEGFFYFNPEDVAEWVGVKVSEANTFCKYFSYKLISYKEGHGYYFDYSLANYDLMFQLTNSQLLTYLSELTSNELRIMVYIKALCELGIATSMTSELFANTFGYRRFFTGDDYTLEAHLDKNNWHDDWEEAIEGLIEKGFVEKKVYKHVNIKFVAYLPLK